MTDRPIMDEWVKFWEAVKPPSVEVPEQVKAKMQQAFFAGALVCFQAITLDLDPGNEITEGDIKRLDNIEADIMTFSLRCADGFRGVQS